MYATCLMKTLAIKPSEVIHANWYFCLEEVLPYLKYWSSNVSRKVQSYVIALLIIRMIFFLNRCYSEMTRGKKPICQFYSLFLEPSNIGNNGNHPRLLWSQPLCYLRTTPVVYALKLMWWLSSRQSLYTTNFFIFSNCLHKLRLSRRVAIMKITIDF